MVAGRGEGGEGNGKETGGDKKGEIGLRWGLGEGLRWEGEMSA